MTRMDSRGSNRADPLRSITSRACPHGSQLTPFRCGPPGARFSSCGEKKRRSRTRGAGAWSAPRDRRCSTPMHDDLRTAASSRSVVSSSAPVSAMIVLEQCATYAIPLITGFVDRGTRWFGFRSKPPVALTAVAQACACVPARNRRRRRSPRGMCTGPPRERPCRRTTTLHRTTDSGGPYVCTSRPWNPRRTIT